jgi:peptidoglycan/xylan/chitin deacetylase (PgdA/CDA1 family)
VNRSIRRTLLEQIGGCCDEAMKDCHEDWDLGIRMWKADLQFRFQPDAIAYHFYVKSDRDLVTKECRLFAKGEVALSRKHPEYRPLSMLAGMWSGSWRHRLFVNAAVRLPLSIEPIARPLFRVLDSRRANPRIRRAAIRLLTYRTRLKIYNEAAREVGSAKRLKAEFGMRLPVLCYHHVGTPKPGTYPDLSVTAERFERDIKWLFNQGYRTISPSDWLRWLRKGTDLPPKPVLLTFDDAYADLTRFAFPVLRQYGFQATAFVVTGQVGGTNDWDMELGSAIHPLMTAEEIRYWAANGIEFGAHSKNHPDLARIPIADAREELSQSRAELAALLGGNVTLLAYPYGSCNDEVTDSARKLFQLAVTTREGLNDLTTDPLLLRRACVRRHESIIDLDCLLRWGRRPFQRVRDRIRLRDRLARAVSLVAPQARG